MGTQTISYLRDPLRLTNPLSCRKETLPVNLVLMVKLIVLGLIMKDYLHDLSGHHLPFWPIFDGMGSPAVFEKILQAFFIVGVAGILLTRDVRIWCFTLGTVFMITVLSSKTNYTNVKFFCACILLLTAVADVKQPITALRYQMALVYLGAGFNKILDADWRSGQYLEHWLKNIIKRENYSALTDQFKPMLVSKLLGWGAISAEFLIGIGYLLKPLHQAVVLTGVYFHSIIFISAWYDFRVFTIAVLASFLILVQWPKVITVRYRDNSMWQRFARRIFSAVDFDTMIVWRPADNWRVDVFGKEHGGFIAFKRLLLYTPFFYFCYVLVLGLPNSQFLWLKLKFVQLALIFFFPWPEIMECLKNSKDLKRENKVMAV